MAPKPALPKTRKSERVLKGKPQPTDKVAFSRATLPALSVMSRLVSIARAPFRLPATDTELRVFKPPAIGNEESSSSESAGEQPAQGQRSRQLAKKQRHRLRKYLDVALFAEAHGSSFLESQAVTTAVQKYYHKEVQLFHDYVAHSGKTLKEPDTAITEYLNHLFWKGEQPHRGEKFLAAWMHNHPEYGRLGSVKLPRSWRALKGWRRLCLGNSRKPMPFCVWSGIAVELTKMKQVRMGLFVVLTVSSYARPSELLRCTTHCLVRPAASALNEWALLLAIEEDKVPTKTGEYDHSVPLDSAYLRPWCPVLLEALKKQHPSTPLWDFGYGEFLACFKHASANLSLELSPYQTRHSGPSIDRAKNYRSLHEVQKRGGWKAHKSVLRYEKAGRLSLSYQSMPAHIRTYCDLCEAQLGEVFLGRAVPPVGP